MKHKGIWIILVMIVLVFGVIVTLWYTNNQERTWQDIQAEQTLRVVTSYNSINYFITDGKPQGFYYEMVRDLADSLGLQLDITLEPDYGKCLEGIHNGDYDLFLTNIPISTYTQKQINLADPIMVGKLVLVQKKKSDSSVPFIEQASDLEGCEVYVENHSPYVQRLTHLKDEMGVEFEVKTKEEMTSELLNSMVARGQLDYVACDEYTANLSKRYHTELDVSTVLGLNQNYSWGMISSPELLARVNNFIKNYKKSGAYNQLYQNYYYLLKK